MLDVITGIALAGIPSRLEMWKQIIDRASARQVLEIGVWKGEFAAYVLTECPSVIRYFMIDPWRQLDAWNKVIEEFSKDAFFKKVIDSQKAWVKRTYDYERLNEPSRDMAYDHFFKTT